MKTFKRRITAIVLSVFSLMSFVLPAGQAQIATFAEETKFVDYQKRDIDEDLKDLKIDKLSQAVKTDIEVVAVMEYCYSERKEIHDAYYGLYIYIYNPKQGNISHELIVDSNAANTVNMAVDYNANGDPIVYRKIDLEYCDKTSNNDYYKFKVKDDELYDRVSEYSQENGGNRRYDISGVELSISNRKISDEIKNANDIQHAKTYVYSGYAKGCGNSDDNTLQCSSIDLETIALELKHTYWRGDNTISDTRESLDTLLCDQINTVYFSVPNRYFEEYGGLQKIRSEWWEYKTQPVFVTSTQYAYDLLTPYLNKDIGEADEALKCTVMWNSILKPEANNYHSIDCSGWYNNRTYKTEAICCDHYLIGTGTNEINWLFKRDNVECHKDYTLSKEELEEYLVENTFPFDEKVAVGAGKSYSKKFFTDTIDESRQHLIEESKKYGKVGNYIQQEIDAGEKFDILEKDSTWWENIFGVSNFKELEISPIVQLNKTIKNISVEGFADAYYIDDKKAEEVLSDCVDSLNNGETPVLFRFAVTDYYASSANFITEKSRLGNRNYNGYVAQETMFFDFDIISLTFRNIKGIETIIPTVADPINVIADIEAPPNQPIGGQNGMLWVLYLIIFALFVVFVVCLINYVKKLLLLTGLNKTKTATKTATKTTTKRKKRKSKKKANGGNIYLFSTINNDKKK